MPLSFLWSVQVSDVFVLLRPLLSFFCFQGLTHDVANVIRLLGFSILNATLVLVVFVVNVTLVLIDVVVTLALVAVVVVADVIIVLLAEDKVLFPHAPALTPTAALAVVALFPS